MLSGLPSANFAVPPDKVSAKSVASNVPVPSALVKTFSLNLRVTDLLLGSMELDI